MSLQQRATQGATHCPNSLLNVQMGVPVGEEVKMACIASLEIMRSYPSEASQPTSIATFLHEKPGLALLVMAYFSVGGQTYFPSMSMSLLHGHFRHSFSWTVPSAAN